MGEGEVDVDEVGEEDDVVEDERPDVCERHDKMSFGVAMCRNSVDELEPAEDLRRGQG